MSNMEEKIQEFEDERENLLETLNGLDFLISPSKLRLEYTEHNNYHKFQNYILQPLMDKGDVVSVPNSTKGDLIQTRENFKEIAEEVLDTEIE